MTVSMLYVLVYVSLFLFFNDIVRERVFGK